MRVEEQSATGPVLWEVLSPWDGHVVACGSVDLTGTAGAALAAAQDAAEAALRKWVTG